MESEVWDESLESSFWLLSQAYALGTQRGANSRYGFRSESSRAVESESLRPSVASWWDENLGRLAYGLGTWAFVSWGVTNHGLARFTQRNDLWSTFMRTTQVMQTVVSG